MKILNLTQITFLIFLATIKISCNNNNLKNKENEPIINNRTQRINSRKLKIDSLNKTLEWKKMKCDDLWISNRGDYGIKTTEVNEDGIDITRYITTLCEVKMLNEVIDTLTFKYLGSSFYKDRNNIYTHFVMSDGGKFWIVEGADLKSFKVIGDCYAKDKKHIFGERKMIMKNVDYKTFKTKKDLGCFAKDKNGYYFWDEKIQLDKPLDSVVKKVILELDKL